MGSKQLCFSDYELTIATKQIKLEKFRSEMEVLVPWQSLIDLGTAEKATLTPDPISTK